MRSPRMGAAAAGTTVAILAAVVLTADQFTKFLALEHLPLQENVPVLGDFFSLYLVKNPGAAFSLGEGVTWIFTIALAAVAGVIVWLAVTRVRSRAWAIVLGLLLGGVLGNLTDRIFREPGFAVGHVIDFINTPWMWFFPGMSPAIYNVADIFIVCDMIVVALLVILGVHMDGTRDSRRHHDDDETILGQGDEVPPGGAVAGFGDEFPVADADAGIPADERGLPPLTPAQQREVEREADRRAGDGSV